MGIKEIIKQGCVKQLDRAYEKHLAAAKVSYHQWVCEKEQREKPFPLLGGESFVVLYQKRGRLSTQALFYLSRYFLDFPRVQVLYGDEDLWTEGGERENPWYKPVWSPDTYLSQFYLGSVIAVRRSVWDRVVSEKAVSDEAELSKLPAGSPLGEGIEGICFENPHQVRKLSDSILEHIGGFRKGAESIQRIPYILFHAASQEVWQSYLTSQSPLRQKPEEHLEPVSVIIPSKDNVEVLQSCLQALEGLQNIEIIVVDNGSREENRRKIEALPGEKKYLYCPMEVNFSKMCNLGAREAKGEYLLFLNDDIEVCGREWLLRMKNKAARKDVGAVGLKLYYPHTKKIQHAGITNLPVGPVHKLQFAEDDKSYYFGRNRGDWNCLAVTAACLMIKTSRFWEVGGFCEELQVAYNDVELGFSLYEAGYHNVVVLDAYAYHHESLSRGEDVTRQKRERLLKERTKLYELHPAMQGEDPYYPRELTGEGLDSRIVPGYVNAGNKVETPKWLSCPFGRDKLREDKCLMINIEQSSPGIIKGYGVILGDDNACYDRYVVLSKDTRDLSQAYVARVTKQYRQDLEENLPDQRNVALCGFAVRLETEKELSSEYQIGMIAVHKVSKIKLLNFSGWDLRGNK